MEFNINVEHEQGKLIPINKEINVDINYPEQTQS